MLKKLDIESRFVNGLRYTDRETMDIVQMVLAGKVNKDLVKLLEQLGGRALGLCGLDNRMLMAEKKAAAEDLGINVTVVGPGAESDIEGQVSMIEQQIGAGCDAIVCAPNDAGAAQGALQAAIDAGIPVLAVDTNVGIPGQTSFVGTSNVDAAYEGGKWAIEQAGTDAKAVIIYGQEGDNTSNMRMEGYEKACTEAGVEVLAKLSGNNLTDGATKAMEDLLSAYPDQIDIVLCHNDDTAIGAMNACKSAGVSDITIVGFDGNASAVKLILDGELVKAAVAQQPYEMGYQVVEAAVKAVKGESVDEVINAPVQVVTAENGQAYLDNLEAMKG